MAAPGGPRLPAVGAPPGAAVGALDGAVCHQELQAGWAPGLWVPPTSVRIHSIRPEDTWASVTGVLLTYERTVGKWRTGGNNIDNSQESRTGVNACSIRTKL